MQLVADRFVVRDGESGRACDLASGSDVVLVVGTAGGVSDQLRWTDRCSALRALEHHSIARLVDFGLLGEASRFEAWSCGPAWAGAAQVSASTRDRVKQFANAAGAADNQYDIAAAREVTGASVFAIAHHESIGHELHRVLLTLHRLRERRRCKKLTRTNRSTDRVVALQMRQFFRIE